MKGDELISYLGGHFAKQNNTASISDSALAREIGQTSANIAQWRRKENITPLQIANLLKAYKTAVEDKLTKGCISPIVEFFEIDSCLSKRGAKLEVFSAKDASNQDHPYRAGMKEALCNTRGLYIFYDSRGRALYAGQATKQPLWDEINSAFNRDRGKDLQSIKIVTHPETKKKYERYDERTRQITTRAVTLHEVATYFSAYEVHPLLISELESLIIRAFANDLLNKKMEHFASKSR